MKLRSVIKKTLLLLLVFAFANIFADVASSKEIYNVYALEEEFFDTEVIHSYPCYMPYGISDEKKAEILFKTLFNDPHNVINYIPKDTKLLGISLNNDELIINASAEIKNYGGSFYERKLVRQILYTAFELDSVNHVTLLIEGKTDYLPQGSLIEKISREEMRKDYTDEGVIICNEEQK
ncbi:MAG: GerMN domain-containing protein [Firmicutes bacterium]|nr:GerMN domain-containing protein [Bacillota bacterium]